MEMANGIADLQAKNIVKTTEVSMENVTSGKQPRHGQGGFCEHHRNDRDSMLEAEQQQNIPANIRLPKGFYCKICRDITEKRKEERAKEIELRNKAKVNIPPQLLVVCENRDCALVCMHICDLNKKYIDQNILTVEYVKPNATYNCLCNFKIEHQKCFSNHEVTLSQNCGAVSCCECGIDWSFLIKPCGNMHCGCITNVHHCAHNVYYNMATRQPDPRYTQPGETITLYSPFRYVLDWGSRVNYRLYRSMRP